MGEQQEKLTVAQAIIVEGKYDKIKLDSIIQGVILVTNGYRIFKDPEKMALIRYFAAHTGIIILTDSDRAGFRIRSYLKGSIPEGKITHVYIPDIFGKEKRKDKPSAEGKLGVEGMERSVLEDAFRRAGVLTETAPVRSGLTRLDLYELGLTGGRDSASRRRALLEQLGLPTLLSTGGMLEVLNTMMTRQELEAFVHQHRNGD
ncbi:toprim domain-containing protein [Ruminococcus sp.]|uniref:toprim domain-containing protein n=1 Tax=Ruminococcus sp. TaxID=41978 RepID=UPI003EFF2AF8